MPSWLSDLVGTDMAPLAYYALVAAIVLALIVIVLAVAKKAMGLNGGPKVKGRGPRLAVLDVSVVDPKRKLVLVRRDDVEHLLLIGGQNDLVVEAGILRGVARQARVEPSIGAEGDYGQGASRAAAPGRGTPTNGPARGPSPLTRPVPRPAQAVAPAVAPAAAPVLDVPPVVSPAPDRSEPVLDTPRPSAPAVAAPVVTPPIIAAPNVTPPVAAPSRDVAAPSRDVETTEKTTSGAAVGTKPTVPAVEPVSPTGTAAPRAAAPVVPAPVVTAPPQSIAPSLNETPKAAISAPAAAPVPRSAPVQPASPVVVAPPAPSTVGAERNVRESERAPQIAVSAMPRPISREPERSVKPVEPAEAAEQKKPAVPVLPPRFSIGGSLEPVQRSGPPTSLPPTQSLQPFQPRSMATPTLPTKPTPAAAELEAKANRPEPGKSEFDRTSDDVDEAVAQKPASPEPSPEEVLARLLAKAKEPVRPTENLAAGGSGEAPELASSAPTPPQTSAAQQTKLEPAPAATMPPVEAPDIGDRRPLSVRSFASAIQGRQSSPETVAPSPTRRDPEIAVPAATPPVSPSHESAVIAAGAPTRQPATSWDDEEDDLGDFLSAQLNDQLGEDIWATKETTPKPSAPAVEPDEKLPANVELPADAPRPTAPAKRPLTLEEEMERLLGDFDLETSDRRVR